MEKLRNLFEKLWFWVGVVVVYVASCVAYTISTTGLQKQTGFVQVIKFMIEQPENFLLAVVSGLLVIFVSVIFTAALISHFKNAYIDGGVPMDSWAYIVAAVMVVASIVCGFVFLSGLVMLVLSLALIAFVLYNLAVH